MSKLAELEEKIRDKDIVRYNQLTLEWLKCWKDYWKEITLSSYCNNDLLKTASKIMKERNAIDIDECDHQYGKVGQSYLEEVKNRMDKLRKSIAYNCEFAYKTHTHKRVNITDDVMFRRFPYPVS